MLDHNGLLVSNRKFSFYPSPAQINTKVTKTSTGGDNGNSFEAQTIFPALPVEVGLGGYSGFCSSFLETVSAVDGPAASGGVGGGTVTSTGLTPGGNCTRMNAMFISSQV
jgi:hypothetical protein